MYKKEIFVESEGIREIAKKLVEESEIGELAHGIDPNLILFVASNKHHPKGVVANIRSVRSPYTFLTKVKFIVVIYKQYEELTEKQQEIVILHELTHIINFEEKKLKKHDVEDFYSILKKYGLEWLSKNGS